MTDPIQNYHRQTQYDPLKMGGHALDWSNQPGVYKNYSGLSRVNLPEIAALPDKFFTELVKTQNLVPSAGSVSIQNLNHILALG